MQEKIHVDIKSLCAILLLVLLNCNRKRHEKNEKQKNLHISPLSTNLHGLIEILPINPFRNHMYNERR